MRYDESRQFYMTFPASVVEEKAIPEDFIHLFKKKKNIECQTLDLWKRNQRVRIAADEADRIDIIAIGAYFLRCRILIIKSWRKVTILLYKHHYYG